MKRSGPFIFLTELMIVILFFSFSVVITLQLFMTAHAKEKESSYLSEALIEAQNTAEIFRARGFEIFSEGGWIEQELSENSRKFTNEIKGTKLIVEVSLTTENMPGGSMDFGEVQVCVAGKEDPLCALDLARYNVSGEEGTP